MKLFSNVMQVDVGDWIIIISVVILYSPFIFAGKVMFWGTTILQFIPWRHIAVEIIRSGELPLWNPYSGMGAPLLANYQSALLYPANWILMTLEAIGGITCSVRGQAYLILIHLFIAGFGMKRWVKELGVRETGQVISGVGFGLSGYLVSRASFQSIILTAAWIPWLLLLATRLINSRGDRKRIELVKLCVVLTLQLLGGHAQTSWYSIWLVTLWVLFLAIQQSVQASKKPFALIIKALGQWGAVILISLLLASPQIVPTLEYLLQSQRAGGVDTVSGSVYSFWPWRAFTILMPNFFGNPAWNNYWGYGNYWEDAIYSGAMAIPLSLYVLYTCLKALVRDKYRNPRKIHRLQVVLFWWVIVVISLLMALGKNLPIYDLFLKLPGYQLFQAPTRISILCQIGLAFLAGWGVDRWTKPTGKRLYWLRLSIAGAVAIILTALIFRSYMGSLYPTISWSILVFGFQALIFGLLLLAKPDVEAVFLIEGGIDKTKVWGMAVGCFFAIDMIYMGWGLNPGADIQIYMRSAKEKYSKFAEQSGRIYLRQIDEYRSKFDYFFRFDTFGSQTNWNDLSTSLLPNMNLLDPVVMINNFDPIVPERYARFMEILDQAEQKGDQEVVDRLLNLSGVKWVMISDSRFLTGTSARQSKERFSMIYCAKYMNNKEDVFQTLNQIHNLGNTEALIEIKNFNSGKSNCNSSLEKNEAKIALENEEANHLIFNVETSQDGWFVLLDTYYPGWRVKVNERWVDISNVNGLFRGVWLEAGKNRVEFYYHPVSFYVGLILSFIGFCCVGFLFGVKRVAHS